VPLYGLYGMFVMILFLTSRNLILSYRLFPWPYIGSVRGLISKQRSSKLPWSLGATVWRRSHGISTVGSVGGLIIGSQYDVSLAPAVLFSF
jgi:hypothetical protein